MALTKAEVVYVSSQTAEQHYPTPEDAWWRLGAETLLVALRLRDRPYSELIALRPPPVPDGTAIRPAQLVVALMSYMVDNQWIVRKPGAPPTFAPGPNAPAPLSDKPAMVPAPVQKPSPMATTTEVVQLGPAAVELGPATVQLRPELPPAERVRQAVKRDLERVRASNEAEKPEDHPKPEEKPMAKDDDHDWIPTDKAAKRLGCHPSYVPKLCERHGIDSRKAGRGKEYRRDQVEAAVERMKNGGEPGNGKAKTTAIVHVKKVEQLEGRAVREHSELDLIRWHIAGWELGQFTAEEAVSRLAELVRA